MTSARVAQVLAAFCALMAVVTSVLLVLGTRRATSADDFGETGLGGLAFLLAFLAFAVIGALIVTRVPGNVTGGLFCAIGLLGTVGNLAYQWADYTLYVAPGALPGGRAAATLQDLVPPTFGLLGLSLLLFPDGRLPSPRWRPAALLACGGSACSAVGYALRPGAIDVPFQTVSNPAGIDALRVPMGALSGLGWPLMAASVALAGVSIARRLRRATGVERQQLKWIALAGVTAGVVMVVNVATAVSVTGIDTLHIVAVGLAFAGFPVTAGIAVLRYRLYDIDVVINRTLVYLSLTVTLAGTYLGSVVVLQLVLRGLTGGSGLAVAGSTLVTAAVVGPARARLQGAVDRRFFRARYDAARTLERFGVHVRDEVDLEALTLALRGVVAETMQPTHVGLWLRDTGQ